MSKGWDARVNEAQARLGELGLFTWRREGSKETLRVPYSAYRGSKGAGKGLWARAELTAPMARKPMKQQLTWCTGWGGQRSPPAQKEAQS